MITSFINPGLIDLRCIQVMGVSVKENDNPIGYFGTGLKYAIAVLLREKHSITIWRGKDRYSFEARSEQIREKKFDLIYMTGPDGVAVQLGITTDLGKNWKLWHALRELESNCRDEGGRSTSDTGPGPVEFNTLIEISGKPFWLEYQKLHEIFLATSPIHLSTIFNVHSQGGEDLFYKGVRVGKMPKRSIFTYDFKSGLDLTEDRTVTDTYNLRYEVMNHALSCDDKSFIESLILAPKETWEHSFNWGDAWKEPSKTFLKAVEKHKLHCNKAAVRVWQEKTNQDIFEDFVPDEFESNMVAIAVEFCEKIGFPVSKFPIRYCVDLGEDVLARAQNGTILLSKRALAEGMKKLASTLIEEYVHLEHNFKDRSTQLQTYLFDKVVEMGERHVLKRPL